jgi:hypothetical protein
MARKISATSSEEVRTKPQLLGAAGSGTNIPSLSSGLVTHRSSRHLGVESGVLQLGVTEQRLDDADVDAVLQQMRGEAVAQRMRPNPLVDARCPRRLDDDPVQLSGADRLACMLAWKQPALGMHHALLPTDLPPLAQQGEHIRREHGVAILPAFAAFDPEQHALAVDVTDLEGRDLGKRRPAP